MSISEINTKLKEIAGSIANHWSEQKSEIDSGLYTGSVGMLMFMLYYNRYSGDDKYKQITEDIFDDCCESICNGIYYAPFCEGLSGMLYGLNHLNEAGFMDIDLSEVHSGYSGFLTASLMQFYESGKFDFLHEATGIALYLLEYGNTSDLEHVADYVKQLDRTAVHDEVSVKWSIDMNIGKKIVYNIALSHGMSSIAVFLARCIEKNIELEISKNLLVGTINYILKQEIEHCKFGSYFPFTSLESDKPSRSRLAWCYGDLGVAIAIWRAGIVLNAKVWRDKAVEVMEFAAGRHDLAANMVVDAGICHGTAGIAQFFKRMYFNTGKDLFIEANKFWVDETLKMARWGIEGAAGFKAWNKSPIEWINSYEFLEGITGIGLVLIASQGDEYLSSWDKILLLS